MTPQEIKRSNEAYFAQIEAAKRKAGMENPPPTMMEWSQMLRGLVEKLPYEKSHYGCLVRDRVVEVVEDLLYEVYTYVEETDQD